MPITNILKVFMFVKVTMTFTGELTYFADNRSEDVIAVAGSETSEESEYSSRSTTGSLISGTSDCDSEYGIFRHPKATEIRAPIKQVPTGMYVNYVVMVTLIKFIF